MPITTYKHTEAKDELPKGDNPRESEGTNGAREANSIQDSDDLLDSGNKDEQAIPDGQAKDGRRKIR